MGPKDKCGVPGISLELKKRYTPGVTFFFL